jgi:flagellar biosynthesis protein FlhF
MKMKTFRAPTMQDALAKIKQELGPDAVILSTRHLKSGSGVMGLLGRSMVEVAAAVEVGSASQIAARRLSQESPARKSDVPAAKRTAAAGKAAPSAPVRPSSDGPSFAAALRSSVQPDTAPGHGGTPPPAGSEPSAAQPANDPCDMEHLRREIRDLRGLIELSLRIRREQDQQDHIRVWLNHLPPRLVPPYHELAAGGLAPSTAQHLLEAVRERARPEDLETGEAVRQLLRRVMTREIKVGGPLMAPGERKKTVILIGPTGVGKTTSLAKLAAYYKLKEQRRVSLITLDTYRVAAVEQLRAYANVIGITLDVALTKREALDYIKRRAGAELILIDTTGRSPRDQAGMEELRRLVTLDHPAEVHLVLSAATNKRDLYDSMTHYTGIPVSRLLFTKLDETLSYGGLFDLMHRTGLALSYFGTGQNVPDELETAAPERLADLLLGGELRCSQAEMKSDGVLQRNSHE